MIDHSYGIPALPRNTTATMNTYANVKASTGRMAKFNGWSLWFKRYRETLDVRLPRNTAAAVPSIPNIGVRTTIPTTVAPVPIQVAREFTSVRSRIKAPIHRTIPAPWITAAPTSQPTTTSAPAYASVPRTRSSSGAAAVTSSPRAPMTRV